jgi:hypothetical protein
VSVYERRFDVRGRRDEDELTPWPKELAGCFEGGIAAAFLA